MIGTTGGSSNGNDGANPVATSTATTPTGQGSSGGMFAGTTVATEPNVTTGLAGLFAGVNWTVLALIGAAIAAAGLLVWYLRKK